jgi:hypothetical protein
VDAIPEAGDGARPGAGMDYAGMRLNVFQEARLQQRAVEDARAEGEGARARGRSS